MKRGWKIVLFVLLALVVLTGGYAAYVFLDYHRIPDIHTCRTFYLTEGR